MAAKGIVAEKKKKNISMRLFGAMKAKPKDGQSQEEALQDKQMKVLSKAFEHVGADSADKDNKEVLEDYYKFLSKEEIDII